MNCNRRVNYDAVSGRYDERTEGGYLTGTNRALRDLAREVKAERVLDLGCGTGRSLIGPAQLDPAPVCFGLDFSAGMLAKAQAFNSAYRLARGTAPRLPFAPGRFDLVFCVHAFHHFPDPGEVVREAWDLLRPGGAFAVVNMDPREDREGNYIYTYFDGVYERDLARFPALSELKTLMRSAGLERIQNPVVDFIRDDFEGAAVFQHRFLEKHSCSQLILLTDDEYAAGLQRMRDAVAEAERRGELIDFPVRIRNRMCYGFKGLM